ncbi:MAE_28990/MAE_18760 family HEPN-like nuclease [Maritalea myrionectae]|uniref:MAE_28990/MAE_18760 family HEPN-like nuclease n=1 Tax=Maritalea myrionectae TaxID=454601 RepID=UPI000487D4B9|nr:MAE_28990/MAE_18760 family HEPN-like nuclease [Maritalea myrionectae]
MIDDLGKVKTWRIRELTTLNVVWKSTNESHKSALQRALVVMCYAHWEGFFCDGMKLLCCNLANSEIPISAINEDLVIAALQSEFDKYKDGKDKLQLKRDLVRAAKDRLHSPLGEDWSVLLPNSNLNFETACFTLELLGVIKPFDAHRIFIDHQLVGWRHKIAHGDNPKLNTELMLDHVHKTMRLMDLSQDYFIDVYAKYIAS